MELLELADLIKNMLEGNAEAQYKVARMNLVGVGMDEIESEAFRLFSLSANQGYERAFLMLARCYRFGWGTQRSIPDAIAWYEKSASAGNEVAKEELSDIGDKK